MSYLFLFAAKPLTAASCVSVTRLAPTETYEINADHGSFSMHAYGFCRVFCKDEINAGEPYTLTVDLLNVFGWKGAKSGHPGVMYNVIDQNNFDILYFRLLTSDLLTKVGRAVTRKL